MADDMADEYDIPIIPDDFEIIPDDEEAEGGVDELDFISKEDFGFGYNIEVNADGTVKYPEVVLTKDIIRTGLSHVARTLDTFEFAYSRYDGRNKNLTDIAVIENYIHLRVIDLSGNQLRSFTPLAPIKHLLVLNISNNKLASLEDIPELPFLQALSAKNNGLTSSSGLFYNSLTYLQLSNNKIETLVDFDVETFPWLSVLELRGNNLKSLQGLNTPNLVRLFVAENQLTSLDGLKNCPNLTHIHARGNKIAQLDDFPNLEQLEYLNIRNNALKRFSQTQHLGNSPNIRTLIAMDNLIATLDDYKVEMIATNLNLRRLDKEPITEIDLEEGRQLRSGRETRDLPMPKDDTGLDTPPMPSFVEEKICQISLKMLQMNDERTGNSEKRLNN